MKLQFAPYCLDLDARELKRDGERYPLTPRLMSLLCALVVKYPEPCTRYELMTLTRVASGRALDRAVCDLRKKLDRSCIVTHRQGGYAWSMPYDVVKASPGGSERTNARAFLERVDELAAHAPDPTKLVHVLCADARDKLNSGEFDDALIDAENGLELALSSRTTSLPLRPDHLESILSYSDSIAMADGFNARPRAKVLSKALYLKIPDKAVPRVLSGMWSLALSAGRYSDAETYARKYLEMAERFGGESIPKGTFMLGAVRALRGQCVEAAGMLETVVAACDPAAQRCGDITKFPLPIAARAHSLLPLHRSGNEQLARQRASQALELSRRAGSRPALLLCLCFTSVYHLYAGHLESAIEQAEELARLTHDARQCNAVALIVLGAAAAAKGSALDGIRKLELAIDSYRSTRATLGVTYFFALLGDAHVRAGQYDSARRALWKALEFHEERLFEERIAQLRTAVSTPPIAIDSCL